jgi:tetratricopeptide (TPR) repeat protein
VKQCPQEDEFLDYSQGRLSDKREAQLERHLVGCEDCREFLALYAQLSEEQPQSLTPSLDPVSDEVVRNQTARILTLIKEDDFNSWQQASVEKARPGFHLSYAQLATAAVALIAVAVTAYWFFKGPSYEDIAARSIALASKNERQIEPRISGNIAWSRYSIERGEEDDEKLALSRAMNRLKSAEEKSASDSDRLALARVYLASGERDRVARALVILQELMESGNRSPAVLNDAGVALFQSHSYREAASLFAEAVEKAPDYEEALFNKALANHRAQLIDEAKRDWTEFIQKSSDEKWKEEAKNYLQMLNRSTAQ